MRRPRSLQFGQPKRGAPAQAMSPTTKGGSGVRLVTPAVESYQAPEPDRQRYRARAGAQWLVLTCYLAGAVALTSRLWADPASREQVGDIRDVDQATWFIRYSATAISHGRLPALVTTAMNAPHGINLMWNTSLLLPGILLTPVTLLAGPQVSLTVALTLGFAGSAASMFFVLRRWQASISAAALGGALYGFSPALLGSGVGHYHLVLAVLPPLIIDALLRIVTGRGSAVRNGLWLGLLASAQLFIAGEILADTAIAGALLLVVLAASRPRAALSHGRATAIGLGTAAGVSLLLCGRALWTELSGPAFGTIPHYVTHLYAFVTPSSAMLFHTQGSAHSAALYPEPPADYLAYLGWPLIIVLLAATIYFWRHPKVRATAVTLLVLELLSLGSQARVLHGIHYVGAWLPWYWLQGLPALNNALPDRFCIIADGAAGALLAFSLDLARERVLARAPRSASWERVSWRRIRWGWVATSVAVLTILPLTPLPYNTARVSALPDGWQATFTRLHLAPGARVLIAPVPNGTITQPMRWQADSGEPGSMIGGDYIAPNAQGVTSRSGLANWTQTETYIDDLWAGTRTDTVPARSQINADLASWKPAAVVAVASPGSRLGRFLIGLLGRPASQIGSVLAWRL
jgi:hypothetical protein